MSLSEIIKYGPSLLEGFFITIALGLLSFIIAVILGFGSALLALSKHRLLRSISKIYTTIIRGIPDIVLIFLIFFGLQELMNQLTELLNLSPIFLDPFVSGIITIGLIFGAFISETFRGALMSVPKGQFESSIALGMSKPHFYRRIIFPQAMRFALPGLSNNWLVMLKTTALVSLIGLHDLVFIANNAGKATRLSFDFYLVTALGFLLLTSASILIIKYLERHYSTGFNNEVSL
ncbi:arginine ABC transporter permease ArtQ [Ignatzschineria indica]|uniref:Arginine ABC transporter permease ArtQ n=1 Tax=Ignatzschineria indica TaxID=472583 RepID=A0A2U2AN93_9GAMM|nr:arginine ABC transporter permease ArtQ [Ignatzschineria indica]